MTRILLLTGAPGVGKTTLVRRVAEGLAGVRLAGFTTEEIREGGRRLGFRIVSVEGMARTLAHVDRPGPPRVGRYGVDLAAIDDLADATLHPGVEADLHLVDEIGRMECLSEPFVAAVRRLLASERRLLATVARRGGGLVAEAKRHPDADLWEVTPQSRDALVERILAWVREG